VQVVASITSCKLLLLGQRAIIEFQTRVKPPFDSESSNSCIMVSGRKQYLLISQAACVPLLYASNDKSRRSRWIIASVRLRPVTTKQCTLSFYCASSWSFRVSPGHCLFLMELCKTSSLHYASVQSPSVLFNA
jgi:hypothetical protein